MVVNSLLFVVTIPVLLRHLGTELYGVFALITTASAVGVLVNFGFNLSLIRFIGEQGKGADSDRDIIISLLFSFSLITIFTIGLIYFNGIFLHDVLFLSNKYINESTIYLFNAIVLSNIFLFVGQILSAVIDSQKKIYISNLLQVTYVLMSRIGIIVAVMGGGSFIEIGNVYIGSTLIWFMFLSVFFLRIWKFTSLSGFSKGLLKRMFKHISYGSKIYLSSLSGYFYEPFVKILIGRYIGVMEVGVFDIAFRMKTMLWSIIERAMYPIVPLIAEYDGSKNAELIEWLSKKIFLLSIPVVCSLYFVIDPLIVLWLGKNNELIIITTRILLSVYLLTASGIPIYVYLMIKNHPEKTFIIQMFNAILGGVFFFLLVPHFGYIGGVIAFVSAVICTQIQLIWWQNKYVSSTPISTFSDLLKTMYLSGVIIIFNAVVALTISNTPVKLFAYIIIDGSLLSLLSIRLSIVTVKDLEKIFGTTAFFKSSYVNINKQ